MMVREGRIKGTRRGGAGGTRRGGGGLDDEKIGTMEELRHKHKQKQKHEDGETEVRTENLGSHSMSYCAAFSEDLKKCTCNVRRDDIRVIPIIHVPITVTERRHANVHLSTKNDEDGVNPVATACTFSSSITLITVASRHEYYAGSVDRLLQHWCGPKVGVVTVLIC